MRFVTILLLFPFVLASSYTASLSSPIRVPTHTLEGEINPSHWTAREVPGFFSKLISPTGHSIYINMYICYSEVGSEEEEGLRVVSLWSSEANKSTRKLKVLLSQPPAPQTTLIGCRLPWLKGSWRFLHLGEKTKAQLFKGSGAAAQSPSLSLDPCLLLFLGCPDDFCPGPV